MRAIAIDAFGPADALALRDVPDPKVGPDSVLIRVRAAAVNPVDAAIRRGDLEPWFPHRFPLIPGWDVAGVVEAVGPAVVDLEPGDEVYAYARKTEVAEGTYAELVSLPAGMVARKPRKLSFAQAAGIPLAGLTAYQALTEALGVVRHEKVLVTAAAGGVGHLAVQIARHLGADVVGTAGTANQEFVRGLGVEPVDYSAGDVTQAVRALHPGGVDAVLDTVGGEGQDQARAALRPGGRIASIVDTDPAKGAEGIAGHYVFVRPSAKELYELASLADEGLLVPEIAEVLPLDRAAEAHRRIEGGHVRGKLVLEVG
jgi:NADPH:quinone reductase-like Zn-dependent oxidoreductase